MLIANKYRILDKLGAGQFGEIFKGINIRTSEVVAIKIELKENDTKMLKRETQIYQYLHSGGNAPGFAQLKHFGVNNSCNYLVMSLLDKSLTDLCKIYLAFSLKTVLLIGVQLVERVKFLHEKGLIHRDIKPDNFLIGPAASENIIHLIDFGFTKRYTNDDGEHCKERLCSSIIGTPNFISENIHWHIDPSRRDDMESILYILLYLFLGGLYWQNITDLDKIRDMKHELVYDKDLPKVFNLFLVHCKNLTYEQTPDYTYLLNILKEAIPNKNVKHKFEWHTGVPPAAKPTQLR